MNLIHGDCLEVLKTFKTNSIDSLVTDPPAGISFMGKDWDSDKGGRDGWIAWMTQVMTECLRVMKPGAHGLVWALPRTSHWTATALEDAGFEVRDVITHLFGQGFPKSLDISKAIDKAAGAERKIVGTNGTRPIQTGGRINSEEAAKGKFEREQNFITAPATDAAKQWSGWGTALKPASEHWILVRKPCAEKTVAGNVLEWGCGGINIDECRVEGKPRTTHKAGNFVTKKQGMFEMGIEYQTTEPSGRFPANLVLSHTEFCSDEQCDIECAIKALDEQSKQEASRFFYCAKISSSERNAGLEDMPDKEEGIKNSSGRGFSESDPNKIILTKNHHPTVKPQKLMRYFCRLITPPNGIVLDPFMGSGSTGLAAFAEKFDFIGIEREADYFEIACKRINSFTV